MTQEILLSCLAVSLPVYFKNQCWESDWVLRCKCAPSRGADWGVKCFPGKIIVAFYNLLLQRRIFGDFSSFFFINRLYEVLESACELDT